MTPREKARVKPRFRQHDGDPVAYVLSANVHRRNITKGSQAMAVAIAYPDTHPGKKGTFATIEKVSVGMLSMVRAVLREFGAEGEIVKQVMAGGSLNEAYES